MARVQHDSQNNNPNPATKWIEWKSDGKCFSFWDKEIAEKLEKQGKTVEEIRAAANVPIKLPFKFAFLQHYSRVGGWNDDSNSRIYSNEVYYIGSEDLIVKCKSGELARGVYKDIKSKVIAAGGKFNRSIYVMLEDGSLANITLKGAATARWSTFFENNKRLIDHQWVEVNSAKAEKKGAVKFNTPEFTLGKNYTKKEDAAIDEVAAVFSEYIKEYFASDEPVDDNPHSDSSERLTAQQVADQVPAGDVEDDEDPLPF